MKNVSNFKGNHIALSLYRLVNSMSPTQKANFKNYARFVWGDKDEKYILLFDLIDQFIREQKDMADLPRMLVDYGKLGPNANIRVMGTSLFNRILDQIRGAHESSPTRYNQLLQALQDIDYLFYQDMYTECYELVLKAKKIAHEIDRPTVILELQIWEVRITARLSSVPWKLDDMQQELDCALKNVQETFTTFLQSQHLYLASKKYEGIVPESIKKRMDAVQLKQHDPLEKLPLRLHYWRLVELQCYYELQFAIDRKSEDVKDGKKSTLSSSLKSLRGNLDFMAHKGKVLMEEEPINYSGVLENYLNKCLEAKDPKGIELLESAFKKSKNKKEEIHRYKSICYYKMLYYVGFNKFDTACEYVEKEDLMTNLNRREHLINATRMSAIRYACVQAYFLNQNFETAMDWAKYIVQRPRHQSLPMAFLMSDLIYFICQFEKGRLGKNLQLQINSLTTRYKRREPRNIFLRDLIITFRQATLIQQNHALKATMKRKKKLDTYLEKNPALLIYGPVLAWIDSRTSGKSLAEEILKYNP